MREGLGLTLTGIALGLAVAWTATRLLTSLLYGVSATDGLTFLAVPGLLLAVALLACSLPLRRALAVDPAVALRHE
jgi:putative ABC transport system permease protein